MKASQQQNGQAKPYPADLPLYDTHTLQGTVQDM